MSNTNLIEQSDIVIMIGTRVSVDNIDINNSVNSAIENQGAEFIYMHPIDDITLEKKYTQFVKYEVGSEEAVVAMLAFYLFIFIISPSLLHFVPIVPVSKLQK
jgi:predicted molibdopterin-dependent oxidoreductase YjgC